MTALLWLLACTGGGEGDTAPAPMDRDSGSEPPADTADTGTPPPPRDLDGDGVTDDLDCDDRDPARTPGRAEAWDGQDNDCDGRADADGRFGGTVPFAASAVYEGRTYSFALSCPATVARDRRRLEVSILCRTEPTDPYAQLLLGETLTLDVSDTYVEWGPVWTGTAPLVSASGWDTDADVRVAWTEAPRVGDPLDTVALSVEVRAPFLVLSGGGELPLESR